MDRLIDLRRDARLALGLVTVRKRLDCTQQSKQVSVHQCIMLSCGIGLIVLDGILPLPPLLRRYSSGAERGTLACPNVAAFRVNLCDWYDRR